MSMLSQETFRMIDFSDIHSIITYSIIFGAICHPAFKYSELTKKIIIIIINSRTNDSCRDLFKKMEILPLCAQYTYIL